MLLKILTTSHWQIRGKEMPPTFEMLLQYFSRYLRAGHLVVAMNKFNFFLIHHFHVGHNAPCLPPRPPPPPHKFCLTIVFDFFWDDCNTQKILETMVGKNWWGGGGGKSNKMHCALCENGEWTIKNLFSKGCLQMDLEITLL